jgi:pimeloyl-ACP methyl ester carboxylesterase
VDIERRIHRVTRGSTVLRWLATATAVLLTTGLVSVPTVDADAVPPPAIAWTRCTDPELVYNDLQCGTLTVPLDHADPGGPKIRLALTRRVHTATPYQGVLLTNPGGPGGSDLTMPSLSDYVPGAAGAAYDWIGMDPRGVGASTPSLHCSRSYFGFDRPSYTPKRPRITRYWLNRSRSYAAGCADTAAKRALLPHLTTLDTVRDMDLLRHALGVEKLSYYGFSYGSYLGEVYATRYPTRVGRFVLDGVVDPTRAWYAANLDQDRAFEANMNVYWHYLAAHPGAFHLGRKWPAIRRGYVRTLRRLDRRPAAGGRLGPDEVADVMLDAGYYVYDWVGLGKDYADLVHHRRARAMLGRYVESQTNDDDSFAMYSAVQCTDASWPDVTRTLRDARVLNRRAPFLTWSNTWFSAPCLTWRAPSRARPPVSGQALTAKILLISETRDAATPYAGALATRRLFPSASLVAGVGGTTHASSLSGVACVDDSVAAYLRTGIVPTRSAGTHSDRSCPRLAPPDPAHLSGRGTTGSADRLSPMLRRDLLAAQRAGLH